MWKLWLFLCVVELQAASPALQELWRQEIEGEAVYIERLKGKHVLFVGGILNGLAKLVPGYFSDNREAVEHELGGESSYFGPSSRNSIPENSQILKEHILKTHFEHQKPLILVGHSKGAAEILHVILEYPDLILEGCVERIILIQAPIQGAPVANEPSRWICYEAIKAITGLETETLSEVGAKTVFDLAFEHYHAAITDEAKHDFVSNRIFYVRSASKSEDHSYCLQLVLGITQHQPEIHGHSDGLIPVNAQLDSRIGIDLGVVQADHFGLVIPWVSGFSKKERKAFTRAVFGLVSQWGD